MGTKGVVLSDSTFVGNTASKTAGAIYFSSNNDKIIARCNFSNNVAVSTATGEGQGGAISLGVSLLSVVNTTFSSNGASSSNPLAKAHGGAIFGAENSVIDLENVRFLSNRANGKGGAIYVQQGSKVQLRGIEMRNNVAVLAGGGMIASKSTIEFQPSNFQTALVANTVESLKIYS